MRRIGLAYFTLILLEFAMVRQVNAAAMAIADASEGCVLRAYKDPAGIWTQGWGHVGQDVKPGSVITQQQADAWRAADMAKAAAFVEAHLIDTAGKPITLTDNQFSALAELSYNIGVGNYLGSTLLSRAAEKGTSRAAQK